MNTSQLFYLKGIYTKSNSRVLSSDKNADGQPIIRMNINSGEESVLINNFVNTNSYSGMMTVYGDYLYLSNIYYRDLKYVTRDASDPYDYLDDYPCGRRVNLKTAEVERYESLYYCEFTIDEMFEATTLSSVGEHEAKWIKDDSKIIK